MPPPLCNIMIYWTAFVIVGTICSNSQYVFHYIFEAEDAADTDFHEGFDQVIVLLEFCEHRLTQMAECVDFSLTCGTLEIK